MKNLRINRLFIFSLNEKKAKVVDFENGINIVTSSKVDGTKKGKSTLLKSIYYTLGADCKFEDMFDAQTKSFIVEFCIDTTKYYIYRFDRMFKLFDCDLNLLFKDIDRRDLARDLAELFQFQIKLPDKKEEKLEIAPPVYSYLLNYVDQDGMRGPYFDSFTNLSQYSNYKENVLYAHFGVFNDEYYQLLKNIEQLADKLKKYVSDSELLEKMINKIDNNMGEASYSTNMEILKIEIAKNREEYAEIAKKLTDTKNKLLRLRNDEYDVQENLCELQKIIKSSNSDLKKLNQHVCPVCQSHIENTMSAKIERYSDIEDVFLLKSALEESMLQLQKKIADKENEYREVLSRLKGYEKKISNSSEEVEEVLRHKGFVEVKNQLMQDWSSCKLNIDITSENLKNEQNKRDKYDNVKKNINARYYEFMASDKQRFSLQEIDNERFKNIRNVFSAGGSNKPISTIIWYFNLLKIKYEFNPKAIRFPLVLDSPNNTELDEEKRLLLFNYLFNNIDPNTQLIISTLGFAKEDYPDTTFSQIVELENNKYSLLNTKDYQDNVELLIKLTSTTI